MVHYKKLVEICVDASEWSYRGIITQDNGKTLINFWSKSLTKRIGKCI